MHTSTIQPAPRMPYAIDQTKAKVNEESKLKGFQTATKITLLLSLQPKSCGFRFRSASRSKRFLLFYYFNALLLLRHDCICYARWFSSAPPELDLHFCFFPVFFACSNVCLLYARAHTHNSHSSVNTRRRTLPYAYIYLQEVIHIEEMKVTFLVGGMRIHLHNLFNGNKVLGASLNMFLNQNAKEVISELRSDLEYGLADIFTGLWNNVFSKLPIKLWLQ